MGTPEQQTQQTAEYQTTLDIDAHGAVVNRADTVVAVAVRNLPFGEAGEVFTMPHGDGGRIVISATNEQLWQRLVADKLAEIAEPDDVASTGR